MEQARFHHKNQGGSQHDAIDDIDLLRRLRTQDPEAFLALYDRFGRQVFRFLVHMTGSRHESEEILQAVYTNIWEGMSKGMGTIGNSNDITIIHETWFSPELHMIVESTQTDPRFGQTTYAITSLSQIDPEETLFQVPPGYTVQRLPG